MLVTYKKLVDNSGDTILSNIFCEDVRVVQNGSITLWLSHPFTRNFRWVITSGMKLIFWAKWIVGDI